MARRKTSKSVSKRIKFTRAGKMVRRRMGVGHSKTRKSNKNIRAKRSHKKVSAADAKNIAAY